MVEQSTVASHNLGSEVYDLNQLLSQFRLGPASPPRSINASTVAGHSRL